MMRCDLCDVLTSKNSLLNCRFCPLYYHYCYDCIKLDKSRKSPFAPFCNPHYEYFKSTRPHLFNLNDSE